MGNVGYLDSSHVDDSPLAEQVALEMVEKLNAGGSVVTKEMYLAQIEEHLLLRADLFVRHFKRGVVEIFSSIEAMEDSFSVLLQEFRQYHRVNLLMG